MTYYSEAGKGGNMRPTNHKSWSNGYDNIQWTKEEDEEFNRISEVQDNPSPQCTLAQDRAKSGTKEKASEKNA